MLLEEYCTIINVTEEQLSIERESDYHYQETEASNLALILVPLCVSFLGQLIALTVICSTKAKCGDGIGLAAAGEAVQCSAWIVLAALSEANRRLGYFLTPRNGLQAVVLCKGVIGFGQVTTQAMAVAGVVVGTMRTATRSWKSIGGGGWIALGRSTNDKCQYRTAFTIGWFISIVCGVAAAVIYHPDCILFRDFAGRAPDDWTFFCAIQSDFVRVFHAYTRLLIFCVCPACVIVLQICSLFLKTSKQSYCNRRRNPPLYTYEPLNFGGPTVRIAATIEDQEMREEKRKKKRALKMLVWTGLIFCLCWTPIHVLKLIQTISVSRFHQAAAQEEQNHRLAQNQEPAADYYNMKNHDNNTSTIMMTMNTAIFHDNLEQYFFALWILYPGFIAFSQLLAISACRNGRERQ